MLCDETLLKLIFGEILFQKWYAFFQIVDSIMALFRVDFSGRGELADRQQKLAQMLSRLQKISEGMLYFRQKVKCLNLSVKLPLKNMHLSLCQILYAEILLSALH